MTQESGVDHKPATFVQLAFDDGPALEQLKPLWMAAYQENAMYLGSPEHGDILHPNQEMFTKQVAEWVNDDGHTAVICAYLGKCMLGFISVAHGNEQGYDRKLGDAPHVASIDLTPPIIQYLYVYPAFRGAGIGAGLVHRVLKMCCENPASDFAYTGKNGTVPSIMCHVHRRNIGGLAFLRKLGSVPSRLGYLDFQDIPISAVVHMTGHIFPLIDPVPIHTPPGNPGWPTPGRPLMTAIYGTHPSGPAPYMTGNLF